MEQLNFPKNSDGDYIIKRFVSDELVEFNNVSVKSEGKFVTNYIVSNKFFEKKLEHKINEVVEGIENTIKVQNKIKTEDILSEKFILKIIPEKEFNPLFKKMNAITITRYTKNSTKVRVEITWEILIKPMQHLFYRGFIGTIKKLLNRN